METRALEVAVLEPHRLDAAFVALIDGVRVPVVGGDVGAKVHGICAGIVILGVADKALFSASLGPNAGAVGVGKVARGC